MRYLYISVLSELLPMQEFLKHADLWAESLVITRFISCVTLSGSVWFFCETQTCPGQKSLFTHAHTATINAL